MMIEGRHTGEDNENTRSLLPTRLGTSPQILLLTFHWPKYVTESKDYVGTDPQVIPVIPAFWYLHICVNNPLPLSMSKHSQQTNRPNKRGPRLGFSQGNMAKMRDATSVITLHYIELHFAGRFTLEILSPTNLEAASSQLGRPILQGDEDEFHLTVSKKLAPSALQLQEDEF